MASASMSSALAQALMEAGVIDEEHRPLSSGGLGTSASLGSLETAARQGVEQDHRKAAEIWDRADAHLARSVRERRMPAPKDESAEALVAEITLAERTAAPASPGSPSAGLLLVGASMTAPSFGSGLSGFARGRGTTDEDAEKSRLAAAAAKEALTQSCRDSRATLARKKALECGLAMNDHAKRKLRMKVTDIVSEISRRQRLQKDQTRARRFREKKARRGQGPKAELGDHSEEALGLAAIVGKSTDEVDVEGGMSPRRVCILSSLTLDELDLMRMNSRFFFAQALESDNGRYRLEDEELIDFFAASPGNEREIPVEVFAQKLRRKLIAGSALSERETWDSWAGTQATTEAASEGHGLGEPPQPLELMPCMGRNRAVRNDMESPTLRKVREVFVRKDMADARLVEERREAMAQRDALNAFQAGEQRREMQMRAFRQKELHKVRMMAAEERKQQYDADEADRLAKFEREAKEKHARGCLNAAKEVEAKRMVATNKLDAWQAACLLGDRKVREQDRANIEEAEANWANYCDRLWKIGADRHTHIMSQSHRNEALKSGIQMSLVQQNALRQKKESDALFKEIETKQTAAAARRQFNLSRYNFVEKAFGASAVGFDRKVHAGIEVDRRSAAWRRAFSEPLLP